VNGLPVSLALSGNGQRSHQEGYHTYRGDQRYTGHYHEDPVGTESLGNITKQGCRKRAKTKTAKE